MKISDRQKEQLRSIPCETISEQLGMTVRKHKALCPFHNDHTPSLQFNRKANTWYCFVCHVGGDGISLVRMKEYMGFVEACQWIASRNGITLRQQPSCLTHQRKSRQRPTPPVPAQQKPAPAVPLDLTRFLPLYLGRSNTFTRAMVQTQTLTQEQMRRAAERYRLGTLKDDVVFWQIDADGVVREGKVMRYNPDGHRSKSVTPLTISWIQKRLGKVPADGRAVPCLFGLHLLKDCPDDAIVAIVESEKTAIICSELLTTLPMQEGTGRVFWLATGGKGMLTVDALRPLNGHRVILFPDTDEDGSTYREWLAVATEASRLHHPPVYVSPLLEHHASEGQKRRKIDIADLILEN